MEYANHVPFKKLRKRMTFYADSVAVPCRVHKGERAPIDLEKMGEVARLEFYALAHIKAKTGSEPELNKK